MTRSLARLLPLGAVASCGDDPLATPDARQQPGLDASAMDAPLAPDAAPATDATPPDAAPPDARPPITAAAGPVGRIEVFDDAVFALFFAEGTIVRVTAAPECVIHVRDPARRGPRVGPARRRHVRLPRRLRRRRPRRGGVRDRQLHRRRDLR